MIYSRFLLERDNRAVFKEASSLAEAKAKILDQYPSLDLEVILDISLEAQFDPTSHEH